MSDLFRTILIMSLSGSALALVLFAIKPLLRNRLPKSAQYYLWLVVIVAFLLPISQFAILSDQQAIPIPTVPTINDTVTRFVITQEEAYERFQTIPPVASGSASAYGWEQQALASLLTWATTYLVMLYPLGVLLFGLYYAVNYTIFMKLYRRRNRAASEEAYTILKALCKGPIPHLYQNPLASTPMLFGVFNPTIILPDQAYTTDQIRSILSHELVHLRRKDTFIKWLTLLVTTLHWFNPIVWFVVRREIERTCELACDEAVIRNLGMDEKQSYGDTLLFVSAESKLPRVVLAATMCEEQKNLKERLGSIMKSKQHTRIALILSAVLIFFAAGFVVALGVGNGNGGHATQTFAAEAPTRPSLSDAFGAGRPQPAGPEAELPAYITIRGAQFSTALTTLDLNRMALTNEELIPLRYMTNLTALWISNSQTALSDTSLTDLSPLAGLTNLTDLHLGGNQISDLTPLAGLTNLTALSLDMNQISDLSPLAGLTNLTGLGLGMNQISDITPLASLTNLTRLHLDGNQMSDLAPLAGLVNLTVLSLSGNRINDLSPLAGLTDLTYLWAGSNPLSDLGPLAGLTNLMSLSLYSNQISDLTPLAGLTNLSFLNLNENQIRDITPLAGLTNLDGVALDWNQISDWSTLARLFP
ncbi:MAG: leucine-rich repeat domain-containing protein [Oscillospiraceae bacterium]|nr:leucine-rich repeat domain-containing protein [Oscillospiraceae bacterium]